MPIKKRDMPLKKGPKAPPQHLPHRPQGDMVFWRADADESPEREYEDILLRRVPRATAHRFRGAAGGRGLTHAQYLSALVSLHESMRKRADAGEKGMAAVLEQLGLTTVLI